MKHHKYSKISVVALAIGSMFCLISGQASAQNAGHPTSVGLGVSRVGSSFPNQQPAAQSDTGNQSVQQQAQQVKPQSQAQGQTAKHAPAPSPMPSPLLTNLVEEALDQAAPLTPDEVRTLRRSLDARKEAMNENLSGRPPARPTTSIYNLDLSPGATPPVVRVEVGQGCIVSFLDAAGRPWPAKVADNFSPANLTLSQFTEHQLSIGTISPTAINAGVAVALEGVPVAITFTVISGQTMADTQVHMVVPQYLKGTPPGVGNLRGQPSLTAGDLMSYLLRTPPPGARKLQIEGLSDALAWQISPDRMVLRTKSLVTTGAFRVQGIGDGTFAYELPLSPQVRVVENDRFVPIRISGFVTGGL